MTNSVCNGSWQRIGDNALGFGIDRYRNHDDKPLWRFRVTRHGNDPLVEVDASLSGLREIQRWCDRAIKLLQTDGGRNLVTTPTDTDAIAGGGK